MSTTGDAHTVFFFLFLKIYLLLLFVDVYEFMCTTCVQVSTEARKVSDNPGNWVVGVYELPHVFPRNWIQVLHNSKKSS